MKLSKRITAIFMASSMLFVSVLTSCGNTDKNAASQLVLNKHSAEWVESIEHIQNQYPVVAAGEFEFISDNDWMSQLDELKEKVQSENMTDNDIYYSIMEIMAQVKNGHTSMTCPYLKNEYVPVMLEYIDGRFYIIAAIEEYSDLIGKELVSVNGHAVSEIFEVYSKTYSYENEQFLYAKLYSTPISHDLLVYAGIADDGATSAVIETPDGTTEVKIASYNAYVNGEYNIVSIYQKYKSASFTNSIPDGQTSFYWHNLDEENRAYYFQFNSFIDRNNYYGSLYVYNKEDEYSEADAAMYPVFSEFAAEMFDDMKTNDSKFDKVVIDLRINTGGYYDMFYSEFIKYEDYLKDKEILVLIDDVTFSAAISACEYLYSTYGAKFVGSETSGAIGGYTTVKSFTLCGTGCVLSYSTVKFDECKSLRQRQDNEYDGVKPDVSVYRTIEDYINGYDRVYLTAVGAQ